MIEKYYKYKMEYKNYVLLIRCGNFYEVLDKDVLLMNEIFNYKIKKISKTFKCGFPIIRLNDVIEMLKIRNVNYVVINDDIVDYFDFKEKNNYLNYDIDTNKVMLNYIRIDKIVSYLNDHVLDDNIDNVLSEMEKLL